MSELDELEATLRAAGDVWFRDELLVKLFRLIEIARQGETAMQILSQYGGPWLAEQEPKPPSVDYEGLFYHAV